MWFRCWLILLSASFAAAIYSTEPSHYGVSRKTLQDVAGACGLMQANSTVNSMTSPQSVLNLTCNNFVLPLDVSLSLQNKPSYFVLNILSADYITMFGQALCLVHPGEQGNFALAGSLTNSIPSIGAIGLHADVWVMEKTIYESNPSLAWRSAILPPLKLPAQVEPCPVPCPQVPCENGGICLASSNYTVCSCPKFYSGPICENETPQASTGVSKCTGAFTEKVGNFNALVPETSTIDIACNQWAVDSFISVSNTSQVQYLVVDILSADYSQWFGGLHCVLYPGIIGNLSVGGAIFYPIPNGTTGMHVNVWQVDAATYDADSSTAWQSAIGGQKSLAGELVPCPTTCPSTPCLNGGKCNLTSSTCICTDCYSGPFCQTRYNGDPTFVYGLGDKCTKSVDQSIFAVLIALYTILSFLGLVQCCRLCYAHFYFEQFLKQQRSGILFLNHGLIFFVCLLRALSFVSLGDFAVFPLEATALLTTLPYLFTFWIFTFLVLQWSSLVRQDFSMARNELQSSPWLRLLFLFGNILIGVIVIIDATAIAIQWKPSLINQITAIILCVVYSITAFSFLFYGAALQQELASLKRQSGLNETMASQERCSVKRRIRLGAFSVSISFMIESFLFAGSTSTNSPAQNVVLSLFDIWALLTILVLYYQGVQAKMDLGSKKSKALGSTQHKSKSEVAGRSVEMGTPSATSSKQPTPDQHERFVYGQSKLETEEEGPQSHDPFLTATTPVGDTSRGETVVEGTPSEGTLPTSQSVPTPTETSNLITGIQNYESPNTSGVSVVAAAVSEDGEEGTA